MGLQVLCYACYDEVSAALPAAPRKPHCSHAGGVRGEQALLLRCVSQGQISARDNILHSDIKQGAVVLSSQ